MTCTALATDQRTGNLTGMPLRVCFLIDNLTVAGTELFLLTLIERMDRSKIIPHLVILNGHDKLSQSLEPDYCPVLRLGVQSFARPRTLLRVWQFRRYLREHRIDIVHTFFADSSYFGAVTAKLAGVPVVLRTQRNTGYWMTPGHRRLGQLVSRMIKLVTTNCEAARDAVLADDPRAQVEVIPNGIDFDRFEQIDAPSRGSRKSPKIVGIVANLRPVKTIDLLVQAAHILRDTHPDALFQVVGRGDCLPDLQNMVSELGLTERFQFLGAMDDVRPFLATLDVAVLCSKSEGISNSILEYMCAARPIVATTVGGTAELIQHEQTGLLVSPGDATALAAAIGRLLTDQDLAVRLGTAARETARQEYSRETELRRYENLYERLATPRPSANTRVLAGHGQGDVQ